MCEIIYEDAAKGSTVGFVSVLATGGKTIDHYELTGTEVEDFTLSTLGVLSVSNTATLSSNSKPRYHLGVVAVDSTGTKSSQVFLDISVVNSINVPPQG